MPIRLRLPRAAQLRRGETFESPEQLQKVIDPACLPPDLNGTGLAYDDGAFASMLHLKIHASGVG